MAVRDGSGIPAVLPTKPQLQFRARRPSPLCGDLDELAHAFGINGHERINGENTRFQVSGKEACCIVSANSEGRLREVIRAKG